MKFILFPTEKTKPASVVLGEAGDVSLYARREHMGVAPTEETAIEDIELRRVNGALKVRSRPIGATGPWTDWADVEARR